MKNIVNKVLVVISNWLLLVHSLTSKNRWLLKQATKFSCSVMSDSLRPHGLQHARLPYHQLTELAETHVHRVGDAILPSHPLSSPSPPAFNLAQHQGLTGESVLCIRWPKYWSFSFSISSSNEYSD